MLPAVASTHPLAVSHCHLFQCDGTQTVPHKHAGLEASSGPPTATMGYGRLGQALWRCCLPFPEGLLHCFFLQTRYIASLLHSFLENQCVVFLARPPIADPTGQQTTGPFLHGVEASTRKAARYSTVPFDHHRTFHGTTSSGYALVREGCMYM
jgi:hypothetical protein